MAWEKIGEHSIGFDMFHKPKLYGEADVAAEATDGADAVVTADGNADVDVTVEGDEAPAINVEIPVTEDTGDIEKVEVAVQYAEKCSRYAESLIESLEAGATAVIQDGQVQVGATDIMPESEEKSDGEVTLGDMNENRIEPEATVIESDNATMDD
jgi:hypothetical protein